MSVKASEISDLIKQRIEKFSSAVEARNVGTVVSVTDGITRIHGLADVRYGEMIEYPGGVFGLYVCDYFEKKHGFAPVGFQLFVSVAEVFEILDIVSVVRHNKSLEMGNYRKAAEEGNFFLRGFNYLFIARKGQRPLKR